MNSQESEGRAVWPGLPLLVEGSHGDANRWLCHSESISCKNNRLNSPTEIKETSPFDVEDTSQVYINVMMSLMGSLLKFLLAVFIYFISY